jgi:hypothetical protein
VHAILHAGVTLFFGLYLVTPASPQAAKTVKAAAKANKKSQ